MSEQKYIIRNVPSIPLEADNCFDTLANLDRLIATTWGKIPHRVVKNLLEDGTDYTSWQVRAVPKNPQHAVLSGKLLHTFVLTRAETLPLLPEHL